MDITVNLIQSFEKFQYAARLSNMNGNISKQQIGKSGELFVQFSLLLNGIESSQLTTDSGIDLVAYSPKKKKPLTIQVKTNLKPKPGGGKGKFALDWWVPENCPADLIALVDLSEQRVWLFKMKELAKFAQQRSNGRYHFYFYVEQISPRKNRKISVNDFDKFLLLKRILNIF